MAVDAESLGTIRQAIGLQFALSRKIAAGFARIGSDELKSWQYLVRGLTSHISLYHLCSSRTSSSPGETPRLAASRRNLPRRHLGKQVREMISRVGLKTGKGGMNEREMSYKT